MPHLRFPNQKKEHPLSLQTCPACRGQRFIEAPIISFRFLLGLIRLNPSLRDACDECRGQGSIPLTEDLSQDWIDPEQPDGYQDTASFAYFNPEPQSPALRGPKRSRETAAN